MFTFSAGLLLEFLVRMAALEQPQIGAIGAPGLKYGSVLAPVKLKGTGTRTRAALYSSLCLTKLVMAHYKHTRRQSSWAEA